MSLPFIKEIYPGLQHAKTFYTAMERNVAVFNTYFNMRVGTWNGSQWIYGPEYQTGSYLKIRRIDNNTFVIIHRTNIVSGPGYGGYGDEYFLSVRTCYIVNTNEITFGQENLYILPFNFRTSGSSANDVAGIYVLPNNNIYALLNTNRSVTSALSSKITYMRFTRNIDTYNLESIGNLPHDEDTGQPNAYGTAEVISGKLVFCWSGSSTTDNIYIRALVIDGATIGTSQIIDTFPSATGGPDSCSIIKVNQENTFRLLMDPGGSNNLNQAIRSALYTIDGTTITQSQAVTSAGNAIRFDTRLAWNGKKDFYPIGALIHDLLPYPKMYYLMNDGNIILKYVETTISPFTNWNIEHDLEILGDQVWQTSYLADYSYGTFVFLYRRRATGTIATQGYTYILTYQYEETVDYSIIDNTLIQVNQTDNLIYEETVDYSVIDNTVINIDLYSTFIDPIKLPSLSFDSHIDKVITGVSEINQILVSNSKINKNITFDSHVN